MYIDAVLKLLPELKTLINLRQQLVVPAKPTVDLAKKVGDNLTSEQRVHNAGVCVHVCVCVRVHSRAPLNQALGGSPSVMAVTLLPVEQHTVYSQTHIRLCLS